MAGYLGDEAARLLLGQELLLSGHNPEQPGQIFGYPGNQIAQKTHGATKRLGVGHALATLLYLLEQERRSNEADQEAEHQGT